MKSSKKRRIRYNNIFSVLGILIVIMFLIFMFKDNLFDKDDNDGNDRELYMLDIINKNIDSVYDMLDSYDFNIDISYKYSDSIDKDNVISQSIDKDIIVNKGDSLELVVSLGKIDKDKFRNDNINELGKVPIMMYHGIKNIRNSDTDYIGGNVDKDGYTRTSEAFRNDLELFYQKGYRMIKLSDYIKGNIDVSYGYSPIILTFDDGNENNIKVTGLDNDGNIIIDPNSAVGILEEFKKKYPDYNVTAIFFVTNA